MKYKQDYDYDEPRPKRRFYCRDRTCGGTDCHNCYPFYSELEGSREEEDAEDGREDVQDEERDGGSEGGVLLAVGEGTLLSATGNQGTATQD